MKRGKLLNAPLSAGRADGPHRRDHRLRRWPAHSDGPRAHRSGADGGHPSLETILTALLTDLVVEKVIMASEIKAISPATHQALVDQLEVHAAAQGKPITIEYCLHEEFKTRSRQSKAIVRSGEVTPYANLILCAGVAF